MSNGLRRLRFPGKQRPYRVRVRKGKDSFKTALLVGRNPKKAGSRSDGGRILSVTKISREEILKIGDYFKLGKRLMDEFRQEESNGRDPNSREGKSREES